MDKKASRNCNATQGSFRLILASHFLQHGVWPVSILLVSHHMRQHTHGSTRSCTTEENSWVSGIQETCRCCRAHQPTDLQLTKIVHCLFLEKEHWFESQKGGIAGPPEEYTQQVEVTESPEEHLGPAYSETLPLQICLCGSVQRCNAIGRLCLLFLPR